MTDLSEFVMEYLFEDDDDECVFDRWFGELECIIGQEAEKVVDGEYDPDDDAELWCKFINDLFNDWNRGYDFYGAINLEDKANDVSPMDLFCDIKCCFKWFKDEFDTTLDITTMDERKMWNTLAYWWIHEGNRADEVADRFAITLKKRVLDYYAEQLDKEKEQRLTCDICFEKKQIEGVCASCNGKYFCRDCWRKLEEKEDNCPFCRGIMAFPHKIFRHLEKMPNKNCKCIAYKRNEHLAEWDKKNQKVVEILPKYTEVLKDKWNK